MYVAKTKVLISCEVTLQLICAFVFAYAKAGFLTEKFIRQFGSTKVQFLLVFVSHRKRVQKAINLCLAKGLCVVHIWLQQ